jgi:DNA mismatch endonuclease (patch repair protein)
MVDCLTNAKRSENMSRIRSKNTSPEMLVRRLVFSMGHRYRLHVKDLPGKPDLVFRRKRKVIFVHGCFWHQHADCLEGRLPRTRSEYWTPKLTRNVERDRDHLEKLSSLGWKVLVLWECEIHEIGNLKRKLNRFLR